MVLSVALFACSGQCPGASCIPSLTFGQARYYGINPDLFAINAEDVTKIGEGRAVGVSTTDSVFALAGSPPTRWLSCNQKEIRGGTSCSP